MQTSTSLLASVPLFSQLDPASLDELTRAAFTRRLAAGQRLMCQGETGHEFYAILSGSIRLTVRPDGDGEPFTLAILRTGDYLGEMALLDECRRSATADALEEAELLVLQRDRFVDLVKSRPEVALALLRGMGHRLRRANEDAAAIAQMGVYQRLVRKLLQLHDEQSLDVPLTPDTLGPMVGAEPAGVKLLLDLMEFDELISRRGDRIALRDVDRLRRSNGPLD
ncbi:MAG: Crp/Fnr family transcriptional regulator [Candidatus Eremiobacterota bacterium]